MFNWVLNMALTLSPTPLLEYGLTISVFAGKMESVGVICKKKGMLYLPGELFLNNTLTTLEERKNILYEQG